ncbi:hypothetical protein ACFY0G_40995 [Streptomyces sp. NPDC001552]|uniref:hypothetical protein n=1 Tax=Streptomyces sp. NPDC001552 TaxID=3364587 RepID=UPI0036978333
MVVFEALIVVVANTIAPGQLFSAGGKGPPSVYRAFSGSGGGVSIASYPGLLGAGLVHPFWIAMQLTAIGALAAAAVAADVESGTIELVMVRPVSRNRLLAERTAAVVIAALALNAAATLTVAAGVWLSPDIHRDVPLSGVFAAGLTGCGFAVSGRTGPGRIGPGEPTRPGDRCDDRHRGGRLRGELHCAGLVEGGAPAVHQPIPLLHAR